MESEKLCSESSLHGTRQHATSSPRLLFQKFYKGKFVGTLKLYKVSLSAVNLTSTECKWS